MTNLIESGVMDDLLMVYALGNVLWLVITVAAYVIFATSFYRIDREESTPKAARMVLLVPLWPYLLVRFVIRSSLRDRASPRTPSYHSAEQEARKSGWIVGRKGEDNVCPACRKVSAL